MRRKPGALVPLELAICRCAAQLGRRGVGEFHGYEIAKRLAGVGDRKLLTAYGTLYRALGRLEHMGLLKSRWEDPEIPARENRPGRRLYTLTASGERTVEAERRAPHEKTVSRSRRRPVTA
jgi:DNA-binding PadR family transcriptional regulator